MALDTHAVVKELVAAGFTNEQAEAVTHVVRTAQENDFGELATKADLNATTAVFKADLAEIKADLAETKADLKAGLAEAKADLKAGLAETKADILKWMVTTIGLQTVLIIAAVLTLVRSVIH